MNKPLLDNRTVCDGNREYQVKRIAWRLQANAHGDLSCRARRRAEELANDADLRTAMPKVRQTEAQLAVTARAAIGLQLSTDRTASTLGRSSPMTVA